MEPTRTIFQQEHGYPSSLSDASEESSGSHSCFDDDEPEPTDLTAVAAEGESEREISVNDDGVDIDDADDSEFFDCIDDSDNDNVETTDKKISIRFECDNCKPFGICTWDTVGAVRDIRVRSLTDRGKKLEP